MKPGELEEGILNSRTKNQDAAMSSGRKRVASYAQQDTGPGSRTSLRPGIGAAQQDYRRTEAGPPQDYRSAFVEFRSAFPAAAGGKTRRVLPLLLGSSL
jgi:hypothetical protein